jgi:hypothetical protein
VGTGDAFYATGVEEEEPKTKKACRDGKPRKPTAAEGTITEDWNGT